MRFKNVVALTLILSFFVSSFAQKKQENKENKKARRIAFISSRLELTPEESKVFWPVFEQRHEEIVSTIKPLKKGKKRIEKMTDPEVLNLLDAVFKKRQLELDIQKKYHRKLVKILPPKKLAKLYHIEKRFKQHRRKGKKGTSRK